VKLAGMQELKDAGSRLPLELVQRTPRLSSPLAGRESFGGGEQLLAEPF
jgi:hypothetical protein